MIIVHKPHNEWERFEGDRHVSARKVAQLVTNGVWTQVDLDLHGLRIAEREEVPKDKVATGDERIVERDGKVVIERDLVDRPPPPPEPSPTEKLEGATGLTVAQIKTVLGIGSVSRD